MKKLLVVLVIGFLAVACNLKINENVECKDSVTVEMIDTVNTPIPDFTKV